MFNATELIWDDETVLEWMVVWLHDNMNVLNTTDIHLKMLNFIVYVFYDNKKI